jgi:hypothetical protein
MTTASINDWVGCNNRLCSNRLCSNRLCNNRLCSDRLCSDRLCSDCLCSDRLCSNRLCSDRLCNNRLCSKNAAIWPRNDDPRLGCHRGAVLIDLPTAPIEVLVLATQGSSLLRIGSSHRVRQVVNRWSILTAEGVDKFQVSSVPNFRPHTNRNFRSSGLACATPCDRATLW